MLYFQNFFPVKLIYKKVFMTIVYLILKLKWLLFSLIMVIFFRKPLNELLCSCSRLILKTNKAKATFGGVDIEFSTQSQFHINSSDMTKAFQSQFVINEEKCVRQSLLEKNLDFESEKSGLIHYLAQYRLTISMLLIDKFTSQKQIEILVYLNSCSASKEILKNYFNESLNDDYLNGLIEKNLIIPSGQNYQITPLGTEYVKFRAQFRFPLVFDKK